MTAPAISVRAAHGGDAPAAAACVNAAFEPYVERIGKPPAPMLSDYAALAAEAKVWVAQRDEQMVGVLVQYETEDGFYIDTVASSPAARGTGVGRALLEFAEAEARARGFASIYLCTNSRMTENQALYPRIGYVEYDRRAQGGYERVFYRKRL